MASGRVLEHGVGDVRGDLARHPAVGVPGELLRGALVHALLGKRRDPRVSLVMDATVLDASAFALRGLLGACEGRGIADRRDTAAIRCSWTRGCGWPRRATRRACESSTR
jgi:hypothetical protein